MTDSINWAIDFYGMKRAIYVLWLKTCLVFSVFWSIFVYILYTSSSDTFTHIEEPFFSFFVVTVPLIPVLLVYARRRWLYGDSQSIWGNPQIVIERLNYLGAGMRFTPSGRSGVFLIPYWWETSNRLYWEERVKSLEAIKATGKALEPFPSVKEELNKPFPLKLLVIVIVVFLFLLLILHF